MVKLLEEEDAINGVELIYSDIKENLGMVPNLFKAMAAIDPIWLELNWYREKQIMIDSGPLDKKTRELVAFAVSVVNNCDYCFSAHEMMAHKKGASLEEINHVRQIIELFTSFNVIANSFSDLPCDIKLK